MHPTLMHDIARYRQADMIREAHRARLAHAATLEQDVQPRRALNLSWLRRESAARFCRPILGREFPV